MSEKAIRFNDEMIRAVLEGRKTMTRRPVKNLDLITDFDPKDKAYGPYFADEYGDCHFTSTQCPYGQVGGRLWVQEAHVLPVEDDGTTFIIDQSKCMYRASMTNSECDHWHDQGGTYRPSVQMPRWASRITLEITGVRVERVQDITEDDAKAEGVAGNSVFMADAPDRWARACFRSLWESIYGTPKKGKPNCSWSANPWVWVVSFKRVEGGLQ